MPEPQAQTRRVGWRARRRIVARYAARGWRNQVLFCQPSLAELSGEVPRRETSGTDGKVIFPDLEAAESAVRELEALDGQPMRAYVCGRSRTGHAHLTRMEWGGRRG